MKEKKNIQSFDIKIIFGWYDSFLFDLFPIIKLKTKWNGNESERDEDRERKGQSQMIYREQLRSMADVELNRFTSVFNFGLI